MDLCTEQGIRDWADERRAARILQFVNGNIDRETYESAMGQIDKFERVRIRRLNVTA